MTREECEANERARVSRLAIEKGIELVSIEVMCRNVEGSEAA